MSAFPEKFERITTVPAYQLVADAIEREIVTGRIRPGEQIGTELELARQFQVNRSTVREGIRLLEQGGLIRRSPSRRLVATLPHYNGLASRISRALVLHEVTFREAFEAALALEIAIVEQAVAHASAQDIAKLEANLLRAEAVADDPVALAALETEFHDVLGRSSGNRVLVLAGEPSLLLIHPTTELILRQNIGVGGPRLLEAHRMYLDALRRRDVEAAKEWVRRHLWDWRKGFERVGKDLDQPVDAVYDLHRHDEADEPEEGSVP